jgi:galactoside 2-L-fucosyltransferase 1/2
MISQQGRKRLLLIVAFTIVVGFNCSSIIVDFISPYIRLLVGIDQFSASPVASASASTASTSSTTQRSTSKTTFRTEPTAINTTSTTSVLPTTTELLAEGWLTFELKSRLGNKMFQYASAYGIAKHNHRQLVFQGKFELRDYFDLEVKHGDKRTKSWSKRTEFKTCMFDESIYDLHGQHREILVSGYLQSWKYFEHYFADIRRAFTMRPHILSQVRNFFANLTVAAPVMQPNLNLQLDLNFTGSVSVPLISDSDSGNKTQTVYVGVHVRRGDTTSKVVRERGFESANATYISHAMLHFIDRFSHVTFIVCSDDLDWCRYNMTLEIPNELSNRYVVRFCNKGHPPVVHLGILTACNHSITTGGTYGWWSAFLTGGHTVYYKGYPRPSSQFEKQFSPSQSDFYLPGWIGLL